MFAADIGIIGSGIVGCAIARQLGAKYPRRKIVVFEKHANVCMETSRFNSGVVHSGFHQNPGSLKARFAYEGSRLMTEYAERNLSGDKFMKCGMLIAISREDIIKNIFQDMPSLARLYKRGYRQGINFKMIGPLKVKQLEPNIQALGGIFIPDVMVVDPVAITENFRDDAVRLGVEFFFNSPVRMIHAGISSYLVIAGNREFKIECLINSAGLHADDIARMAGFDQYKIYPWRGEYYELTGLPSGYVRTLVYPAMPKNSPGKGMHFRPSLGGNILIGPSAMPVDSKKNYENHRLPKGVFLNAARKFFPEIKEDNLIPGYAGIRPKLRSGGEEDDFIISADKWEPPMINLVGIESPGLSSSMAIAEYVGELLREIDPF